MATATVPPVRPAAPWRGDDFPSWLSPMLVKELRQGIQSGAFAWTFIGLQAVMFLVMTVALANRDSGLRDNPAVFWVPVVLAVAVVIPLRGLGAVTAERAGNNLDLVRLTHLSATRIVTGKWLAIAAQSLLLATAVLPYLVLRYFFGGVNVVRDLAAFGWMLVAAVLVAAAAIAASTRPVRERIGLLVLMFLLGNGLLQAMDFAFGMGGMIGRFPPFLGLAIACLYTVLLLEHAAAAIAPPAENHAARKRWLGLVIAVAWLAAAALEGSGIFWIVVGTTLIPLVALAAEALCEQPRSLASIHEPFARAGLTGRLAAFALTPGWATGLVFVTLVGGMCCAGMVVHAIRFDPLDAAELGCMAILGYAAVVFPLPAVVLFARARRQYLLYVIVQAVCLFVLVFHSLAGAGAGANRTPLAPLALFPLAALLWAMGSDAQARFTLAIASVVVTIVVYGLVAGPWYRELAATWRRVAAAGGDEGRAEAVA